MGPGEQLVASVSERVVATEIARRLRGRPFLWSYPLDSALPPVTLLADRAFPRSVLERRLRFLRAVGWYPDGAPVVTPGVDPALPPYASLEDHVAAVFGGSVVIAEGQEWSALVCSLRERTGGVARGDDVRRLDDYFDRVADDLDPAWREKPVAVTSPAWSRLEAATVGTDRWFGRGRSGRLWPQLSAALGRLGEEKRRRWG